VSDLPIVSVVIPAHNEESVLAATLERLLAGTVPGEFDVIVVPNACTDATAEIARAAGVTVIETPVPGKVPAIRLGDDACQVFPRVYLDADVSLTADAVRALVSAAARPGVLACAPVPELDLAGVGALARRLHRAHEALVAPSRALAGVGVYVLSAAGHDRVFPMPDVISDDGWVHNSFDASERVVVVSARSRVRPARTVRAHLNRRVRVRQGNQQLAALGRPAPQGRLGPGALVTLVRRRKVGPLDAAAYLGVQLADRVLTRFRRQVTWATDASSR
jgi:glycosyltransferase involved in cell wall biosynthesis